MIVRAIDHNGDWTFGSGIQNYKTGNAAIAQSIQTRLQSFLGNCWFATNAGMDWFNLLGKNIPELNIAVNTMILNTTGVVSINQTSSSLDTLTRTLNVVYSVNTVNSASVLNGQFSFQIPTGAT